MKLINKFGFTIAEILITLGIIGVVAAMTLPTLKIETQKKQFVAGLEQSYSMLNQLIKLSEITNGPMSFWDWGYGGTLTPDQTFKTYFAPYLKIAKYCNTYSDCGYTSNTPWLYMDKSNYWIPMTGSSNVAVILSNGSLLAYRAYLGSTLMKDWIIDVNSSKGPNILGQDTFQLQTDINKGILPYDYTDTDANILNNCKVSGYTCATKILKDGWQMKNDYPW